MWNKTYEKFQRIVGMAAWEGGSHEQEIEVFRVNGEYLCLSRSPGHRSQ